MQDLREMAINNDNAHNVNCMTKGFIQDPNVPPIVWDNKNNDDENKISALSPFFTVALVVKVPNRGSFWLTAQKVLMTHYPEDCPSYYETLTRFSSGSYTIAGYGYANSIIWFQGNVTKRQAREWLEMNIDNIVPEELRGC